MEAEGSDRVDAAWPSPFSRVAVESPPSGPGDEDGSGRWCPLARPGPTGGPPTQSPGSRGGEGQATCSVTGATAVPRGGDARPSSPAISRQDWTSLELPVPDGHRCRTGPWMETAARFGDSRRDLPPSSSGLGRLPFKEVTRVRIPLGVPHQCLNARDPDGCPSGSLGACALWRAGPKPMSAADG